MGWLSWLCGGDYRDRFNQCCAERVLLVEDAAKLRGEVVVKAEEISRLQMLLDEAITLREAAEGDAHRFYELLQQSVQIPKLPDLSGKVKVYPYDMTPSQWKDVQPLVISDVEYYAWDEATWLSILSMVQPLAKKLVGRVKPELADCDNYTLTMCDLLSLAFNRAGLDRQGAFMKLLSKPHSYCGFMLPNYTVRVYEPMSGVVVGWLGETGAGEYGPYTYKSEQALFLS